MRNEPRQDLRERLSRAIAGLLIIGVSAVVFSKYIGGSGSRKLVAAQDDPVAKTAVSARTDASTVENRRRLVYQSRRRIDTGGFLDIVDHLRRWKPDATLARDRRRLASGRHPYHRRP